MPTRWYCHCCRRSEHRHFDWRRRKWHTWACLYSRRCPYAYIAYRHYPRTRRTHVLCRKTRSGSVPADATQRKPPCRQSTAIDSHQPLNGLLPVRVRVCIITTAGIYANHDYFRDMVSRIGITQEFSNWYDRCGRSRFVAHNVPSSRWLWCRDRSFASPKLIYCDRQSRRWRTDNSRHRPWRMTDSKSNRQIHRCQSRSGLSGSPSSIFWCVAEIRKVVVCIVRSFVGCNLLRVCGVNDAHANLALICVETNFFCF